MARPAGRLLAEDVKYEIPAKFLGRVGVSVTGAGPGQATRVTPVARASRRMTASGMSHRITGLRRLTSFTIDGAYRCPALASRPVTLPRTASRPVQTLLF